MNLFIQLTKWLKKGLLLYVFGIGLVMFFGLNLFLEYKRGAYSEINQLLVMTASVLVTICAGIFIIPQYKIIHYLGELLKKVRDNQSANATSFILSSEEFRHLKKYLIIQILVNLVILIKDIFEKPHPDTDGFLNYVLNREDLTQVIDGFYLVFTAYEWIFPSFSFSMPIYFLGAVYALSYIYDENLKLKSELNEVI